MSPDIVSPVNVPAEPVGLRCCINCSSKLPVNVVVNDSTSLFTLSNLKCTYQHLSHQMH